MKATDPLLSVERLSVSFETPRGRLRALTDVSFDLERGECLGIVGESGSGKSVLGRAVMDLLPPNARVGAPSVVMLGGRDVTGLTPVQAQHFWGTEVSMVFQDPMTSLNPVRRIGSQIIDPLRFHLHLSRRAARDRAAELLARVGLSEVWRRLDQYPHELSGGMRQRVMIAIAMACSPRLLIADEPTTALDVTVQKQILDLLRTIQQDEDMAMILISHDLSVVAEYAHRVAVMYAGQIVEVGPSSSLSSDMKHRYTEALLLSTPLLSMDPHQRLAAIPGAPPDLVMATRGCPFAPRCLFADDDCRHVAPELEHAGRRAFFRCHHPVAHDGVNSRTAQNSTEGTIN